MPAAGLPRSPTIEPRRCPGRASSGAFRRFCIQIAGNAMLRAQKKTANGLADWTRSEPTTTGIAERSADRRRRLFGLALVEQHASRPGRRRRNRFQRGGDARRDAGVVAYEANRGPSTASPSTGVPVDLYSILTGSKLVRVNRATQEVEPALVESWTISPDNRTYTLTLRDGVTWSDGVAVHVRGRALQLPGDLRPEDREPARQRPSHRRQAVRGDRARCADGGHQPAGHLWSRRRAPRQRHRRRQAQARSRAQGRQVRAGDRRRHAARRPRVDRPVQADLVLAGAAPRLRPQSALLEEGRGGNASCRISIR